MGPEANTSTIGKWEYSEQGNIWRFFTKYGDEGEVELMRSGSHVGLWSSSAYGPRLFYKTEADAKINVEKRIAANRELQKNSHEDREHERAAILARSVFFQNLATLTDCLCRLVRP